MKIYKKPTVRTLHSLTQWGQWYHGYNTCEYIRDIKPYSKYFCIPTLNKFSREVRIIKKVEIIEKQWWKIRETVLSLFKVNFNSKNMIFIEDCVQGIGFFSETEASKSRTFGQMSGFEPSWALLTTELTYYCPCGRSRYRCSTILSVLAWSFCMMLQQGRLSSSRDGAKRFYTTATNSVSDKNVIIGDKRHKRQTS